MCIINKEVFPEVIKTIFSKKSEHLREHYGRVEGGVGEHLPERAIGDISHDRRQVGSHEQNKGCVGAGHGHLQVDEGTMLSW